MTESQISLNCCLSFILGIALNSFFAVPWSILLALLILGAFLFSFFLVNRKLAIIGFCLIFLALGIWRHQSFGLQITKSELRKYSNREEPTTLVGTVIKEPDIRETNIKLITEIQKIELAENTSLPIKERVLVTTSRYPEYEYGDKLKIRGKLETPQVFEDFNYQDYLAKQGIHSVIYWPDIESLSQKNYGELFSVIYAEMLDFKNKLREVIDQNLSPPQSSILAAVILGDKRRMSQGLKEKLNITGLRHITAISGMHITILSLLLLEIFLGLGFWRRPALYLSLAFLILFIVMIGAPSSAVRAGIMGGLLILGQSLGRLSQSARAIVFAGAAMLAINPLLLKSDVGFQLSFLATLGIIYLMPVFQGWLKRIPDDFLGFIKLKSIASMTFAAQIFTLPILIYNFGYFSLVSPLTNILIVPLLPFLMMAGFFFILAGAFLPFLGWLLSFPVWCLLTYIIKLIDFFSKSPWSTVYLTISWLWLLVSYFILACLTRYLDKKFTRPSFLR